MDNFRKAYDMVPHNWILKTLELAKTATNIKELLKRSMQSRKMVLFSGKNRPGKVNIRRGIFQGVTLFICSCSDSCYNNP